MKLKTIAEQEQSTLGTLGEVGHTALDIAGLIPGVGEPIDLANALWYAEEGRYFEAALSLISLVPGVGDAIGKGIKYLGKSGKLPAKFMAKHGDDIARNWPKIKQSIGKMEKFRPHLRELDNIINQVKRNSESGNEQ